MLLRFGDRFLLPIMLAYLCLVGTTVKHLHVVCSEYATALISFRYLCVICPHSLCLPSIAFKKTERTPELAATQALKRFTHVKI